MLRYYILHMPSCCLIVGCTQKEFDQLNTRGGRRFVRVKYYVSSQHIDVISLDSISASNYEYIHVNPDNILYITTL